MDNRRYRMVVPERELPRMKTGLNDPPLSRPRWFESATPPFCMSLSGLVRMALAHQFPPGHLTLPGQEHPAFELPEQYVEVLGLPGRQQGRLRPHRLPQAVDQREG